MLLIFYSRALNTEGITKKLHNLLLFAALEEGEEQTSEVSTCGLDNCDIH